MAHHEAAPDPLVVFAYVISGLELEQGAEVFLYADVRGERLIIVLN